MSRSGSRFHAGQYRNNHPHDEHGAVDALKWIWGSRGEMRKFRKVDFPKAQNDPAFLKSNRNEPTLTWVGHATFLLQLAGLNLLTDPVFSRRTSPFSFAGPERLAPLGLELQQLPAIDLVLVSHNHYDHLDEAAVKVIAREHAGAHFVVPLGLRAWFVARGITRVTELDWWQSTEMAGTRITAVPVQHFSGRGLHDRNATLWCGFVVEAAAQRVFFAGDTGYSPDFAEIGRAFAPIDLALLPIGAYAPRWFMRAVHTDPEEAVRIFQDIGARYAVGMHWGTFRLTLEPLDEPPARLNSARSAAGIEAERFFVMQHGETRRLAPLLKR